MMLTPGVGVSLPALIQEQNRQIRQQAILWRDIAAEMRGQSQQLQHRAQLLMTVSRQHAQRTTTLLSVLQQRGKESRES